MRTSILPAHLARLPAERRERFAAAIVAGVRLPLDYVRLNVSAIRGHVGARLLTRLGDGHATAAPYRRARTDTATRWAVGTASASTR